MLEDTNSLDGAHITENLEFFLVNTEGTVEMIDKHLYDIKSFKSLAQHN